MLVLTVLEKQIQQLAVADFSGLFFFSLFTICGSKHMLCGFFSAFYKLLLQIAPVLVC